jgi:hypothetical protein
MFMSRVKIGPNKISDARTVLTKDGNTFNNLHFIRSTIKQS